MKFLLALVFLFSINVTAAWDGRQSGHISVIEVTQESNYAFRVWLKENLSLCGNNYQWAYLNKSDSNYEVYVSVLTAAKFAESNVTLFTMKQPSGYCKIGHISVR